MAHKSQSSITSSTTTGNRKAAPKPRRATLDTIWEVDEVDEQQNLALKTPKPSNKARVRITVLLKSNKNNSAVKSPVLQRSLIPVLKNRHNTRAPGTSMSTVAKVKDFKVRVARHVEPTAGARHVEPTTAAQHVEGAGRQRQGRQGTGRPARRANCRRPARRRRRWPTSSGETRSTSSWLRWEIFKNLQNYDNFQQCTSRPRSPRHYRRSASVERPTWGSCR